MSKEHTAWALLCHHWKSEFVPKAATAQRTAGSVCMQARLIHRLRRREAVKSWLRFHLNLPFHSKGASSFLSVLLSSQHLFDYFTNLGWPNNLPFFLPSFLDYHLISLARKGNPYIHVLVGDSKEQNVKLMVEEVFLLPLKLMSLLAPDLFYFFPAPQQTVCSSCVNTQSVFRTLLERCGVEVFHFKGPGYTRAFQKALGILVHHWAF